MTHPQASASSILSSVMASVDDIKEKIDDGEYLNLCNLLKQLHEQIKNNRPEPAVPAVPVVPAVVREVINNNEHENNRNIELILGEYLSNPEFYYEGNLIANINELIDGYNEILKTIEEEHNETGDHQWFICACGCSVNTNAISEHINNENHALNFEIN